MFEEHALEQLNKRLNFLPETERALIGLNTLIIAKSFPQQDVAVKMKKLKGKHISPDQSNGNQVWAIIRSGKIKTFMLRRRTQGNSEKDFNVDFVITNLEVLNVW
jgi:hypothetical protein